MTVEARAIAPLITAIALAEFKHSNDTRMRLKPVTQSAKYSHRDHCRSEAKTNRHIPQVR